MTLLSDFILETRIDDVPDNVKRLAKRCLIDVIGVAAAGSTTKNAHILCEIAKEEHASGGFGARILFDGERVSMVGAAMANASMIDSFDAHDGHPEVKGHAGVVVVPAALAISEERSRCSGEEFLLRIIIGYEIAIRAGLALHGTATDYHTSGAWNALGAAALASRALSLSIDHLFHALGTAEYYGPRSQMMRAIDFPTMVKDGATYGAHVGIMSALLAQKGFTGGPAVTVTAVEVSDVWSDLGTRWRLLEQYFKPMPVCRWAQPAIAAAASLKDRVQGRSILSIEVETFTEASKLAVAAPRDTEEAQYALPFPLAAFLIDGEVSAQAITTHLRRADIIDLAKRVKMTPHTKADELFPQERIARVKLHFEDGGVEQSSWETAEGDAKNPLTDQQIREKFLALTKPVLGEARSLELLETLEMIETTEEISPLLDQVTQA